MILKARKVILSLFTVIFAFSFMIQTEASAAALENGTYEISYDGKHITEDKLSAAESMGSLIKPAQLEVKNGKMTAFVTMTGSAIKYENNAGEMVPAKIVKEDGAKKTYEFQISNLNDPIIVGTHVVEVGIDVEFRIFFNESSMKKIAASNEQQKNDSGTAGETPVNPKTSDSLYSTLPVLGLLAGLLGITTIVLNRKKLTRN